MMPSSSTSKSNHHRRQKGKNKSDFFPKPPNQRMNHFIENEIVETMKIGKLIGVDFNTPDHVDHLRKIISAEQVTKPSTSKSSRRKGKKSNFVPKPKQVWQVKQPTRNWLDLPSDVMANILSRIGVFDILDNAQKVCTTWRRICKEPAMWRVVSMDSSYYPKGVLQTICKHVVDRSQGQMVDICIKGFCDKDLLRYIADRSSQLRCLKITYSYNKVSGVWGESLNKLSLLEELSICETEFSRKDVEAAGLFCPLLKTLKVNRKSNKYYNDDEDESRPGRNTLAVAIGKNLPGLKHLELIDDTMTDVGLRAILDGCSHLELLDLRRCMFIDLKGDLGKRCSEQIKHLKLPHDSLEGCPDIPQYDSDEGFFVDSDFDCDYFDEYDEYDDYTSIDYDNLYNFEDPLEQWIAYKDMLEELHLN
uniref:F-box protein SKIP19-like n=1 Tax=Erigeron canadensis TaxID=72917 RepID=UPI001CB9987A|nr:F-box protein SKIP19-like [Erigeron canadensis]